MVSRGHKIDWLLHSEAECNAAYTTEWSNCTVYVGRTDIGESLPARIRKHFYSLVNDLRVFRLSKQHDYDFILVKDKFLAAVIGIVAAYFFNKKFVYWLSYPFPEASIYEANIGTARYPRLYKLRGYFFDLVLYRGIAKCASFIFVQSEQMKNDMAARGVERNLMQAVPMGFAQAKFDQFELGSQPSTDPEIDLLYLGTLLGARKMDFLVRVLAQVHEQHPKARLVFVGDGETDEDRAEIIAETKRLGLEEFVTITGFMPQDEALAMVQRARVCLSPFYPTPILNSTSPTKLIEYMALGKAVVANDHPEQSLVLAESGAGLCVAYDEKEFADAVNNLLNDPEARIDMGRRGHAYVAAHRTYTTIADSVEKTLLDVLAT